MVLVDGGRSKKDKNVEDIVLSRKRKKEVTTTGRDDKPPDSDP